MVANASQECVEEGMGLQIALSQMLQEMEKEHFEGELLGWRPKAIELGLRRLKEAA